MADRAVPFRAGGPRVFLADISEFQPDIADAAYLAWSKAIIIRAMYGDARDDAAWYGGQRRDLLHQGGAVFLGIYQYVVPGQDAAAQARALVSLLGPLRPGELPVADLETGGPGQQARWEAWAAVIKDAYGISPWLYSGLDFARAHGLSPQWVAAYQESPPQVPHLLWQFTDRFDVPGAGTCDCSVYDGSLAELASWAWQPSPVPSWQEALMNKIPELSEGARDEAGHVFWVHRLQALTRVYGEITGLADAAALTVTGVFDAATKSAVQQVQAREHLAEDGIAGPLTWSVLITGSP